MRLIFLKYRLRDWLRWNLATLVAFLLLIIIAVLMAAIPFIVPHETTNITYGGR